MVLKQRPRSDYPNLVNPERKPSAASTSFALKTALFHFPPRLRSEKESFQ